MTFVRVLPVILSSVLMGAHFFRAGLYPLVALCLALPFLLLARRPWTPRTLQAALLIGALEWIRTLVAIAGERRAAGAPWIRMAVILGIVALVTAASALVFTSRALRARYGLDREPGTLA